MAVAAAVGAAVSVVGGILGYQGHRDAAKAAYAQGQIEYHQELQRSHYEAKVLQRRMIEEIHMQMAQAGGAGVVAGVGSPLVGMLNTLNDLTEDRTQILRNGAKNAWKLWNAGSAQYSAGMYRATGSLLSGVTGGLSMMD